MEDARRENALLLLKADRWKWQLHPLTQSKLFIFPLLFSDLRHHLQVTFMLQMQADDLCASVYPLPWCSHNCPVLHSLVRAPMTSATGICCWEGYCGSMIFVCVLGTTEHDPVSKVNIFIPQLWIWINEWGGEAVKGKSATKLISSQKAKLEVKIPGLKYT